MSFVRSRNENDRRTNIAEAVRVNTAAVAAATTTIELPHVPSEMISLVEHLSSHTNLSQLYSFPEFFTDDSRLTHPDFVSQTSRDRFSVDRSSVIVLVIS